MAPGVDAERAPADKTADGLGVFDTKTRKIVERWHAGSDPEQFAISNDGKLAFIAMAVYRRPSRVGPRPTSAEIRNQPALRPR